MKIVVFCEAMNSAGLSLIGQARRMAPEAEVIALCEGFDDECCFLVGADETVNIGAVLDDCAQGSRIAQAIEKLSPDIALFSATVRGRFLSAWAAGKLKTGLTADCTALSLTEDGLLKQTRPAFGGNLTADILCRERRPQMASVRPGVFPIPERKVPLQRVRSADWSGILSKTLMMRVFHEPAEGGVSLQNARVIVAGGKGVGGKEGFELLHQLARLLGGAVGATRSAVDAGWISYAHQIGQTGVIVRPTLYIAFGISGMVQHIVGMSASQTVVAVNTDRHAPIFQAADFGIVAPWRETAFHMIQSIKERKEKG